MYTCTAITTSEKLKNANLISSFLFLKPVSGSLCLCESIQNLQPGLQKPLLTSSPSNRTAPLLTQCHRHTFPVDPSSRPVAFPLLFSSSHMLFLSAKDVPHFLFSQMTLTHFYRSQLKRLCLRGLSLECWTWLGTLIYIPNGSLSLMKFYFIISPFSQTLHRFSQLHFSVYWLYPNWIRTHSRDLSIVPWIS